MKVGVFFCSSRGNSNASKLLEEGVKGSLHSKKDCRAGVEGEGLSPAGIGTRAEGRA